MNTEVLGEMAGEIANLLRGRYGLCDLTSLATHSGATADGTGERVQVVVSDVGGKALLSVSIELSAPRKEPLKLTLRNRVHHGEKR